MGSVRVHKRVFLRLILVSPVSTSLRLDTCNKVRWNAAFPTTLEGCHSHWLYYELRTREHGREWSLTIFSLLGCCQVYARLQNRGEWRFASFGGLAHLVTVDIH